MNFSIKTVLLTVLFFSHITKAACIAPLNNFDVKQYGAIGDGLNIDTKAINKAIDAASAAGGGTVYFPAGNYLTGSIHLKSNISLFIDQGCYHHSCACQRRKRL